MIVEARQLVAWGGLLLACVGTLSGLLFGPMFGGDVPRTSLPIIGFALTLALTSFAFVATSWGRFAPRSAARLAPASALRNAVLGVFATGLVLRLLLLFTEPILEVDFNRYLWDGGVTGRGLNPYALSPRDVGLRGYGDPLLELSKVAGPVFDAISYPELKTVYPPVAQAFFALAHAVGPWSLTTWRLICIAADVASFILIVKLLRLAGLNPLAVALYWWNPLVLKEIVNSAHMEAVLMPLILAALWFAARQRPLAAMSALSLAIGTKVWPLVLVPLLLRPLVGDARRLVLAVAILVLSLAAFAWPVWTGGLGPSSGFVSFAEHWSTNSALVPALTDFMASLMQAASAPWPGRIARGLLAAAVIVVALRLSAPPLSGTEDLLTRAYWIVTALLLASPAQFPWYVLWVLPLAVFVPYRGWHIATALLPLYYTAFYFQAHNRADLFDTRVVWLIWLPIWFCLARDIRLALGGDGRVASQPQEAVTHEARRASAGAGRRPC